MSELNIYGVGASQASSDYIGFTFNGVHSDTLGIKRTSEGSRFNENLLPTIQDKTVQVPGGDGMYHFGSYYTQRQFNISYAFDALTEEQLAEIKRVFGDKKIHTLVFDEMPFKTYQAKVTGSASIKHIPFAEGETNRIYKGEGSIQFTAYDPYARCKEKYLSNDYYKKFNNIEEWKGAANLLTSQGDYDVCVGNAIKLYNPGDKEADFVLTFRFDNRIIPAGKIYLDADSQLSIKQISRLGEDTHIKINTKLNLIEGYVGERKSGNIYNRFIASGTFFKIPCSTNITMTIDESNLLNGCFESIEYDYIYL